MRRHVIVLAGLLLLVLTARAVSDQVYRGGAAQVGSNLNIQSTFANGNITGTATINWNNGQFQTATLTGNTTLTFSNPANGAFYCLSLKQDATGGRKPTWPTAVLPLPIEFDTAYVNANPNQTNSLCFIYDGTNYRVMAKDTNSGWALYDLATDATNWSRLQINGAVGGSYTIGDKSSGAGVNHDLYVTLQSGSMHFQSFGRGDDFKVDAYGSIFHGVGPVAFPGSSGSALAGGAIYKFLNNSSVPTAIASTNTETFFGLGGAGGKLDFINTGGPNCGSINCPQARVEIEVAGVYGTNGATDTVRLRFYFCQTSGACAGTKVLVGDTGVITPGSGVTNQVWNAKVVCNVFTVGATGTLDCQGLPGAFVFTTATAHILTAIANTSTATVDTTQDEWVGISATWNNNSASNTITARNISIKVY